MVAVTSLTYPKKSHRKIVKLPDHSEQLAEFFGIMIGDGGIGNPWQAIITLNSIADKDYSAFLIDLCERLFGIVPAVRKRKNCNALVHVLTSISLVDFLIENGLKRGDKIKAGLSIPGWILAKREYRIACIRGLMDTDGCIYIHKHKVADKRYQNIGLNFCSYSPALISQFKEIFEEFNLLLHSNQAGNNLFLYKERDITRYFKVFGTSNTRLSSVYKTYMDRKSGGVG